jgi:hypothetical protein
MAYATLFRTRQEKARIGRPYRIDMLPSEGKKLRVRIGEELQEGGICRVNVLEVSSRKRRGEE